MRFSSPGNWYLATCYSFYYEIPNINFYINKRTVQILDKQCVDTQQPHVKIILIFKYLEALFFMRSVVNKKNIIFYLLDQELENKPTMYCNCGNIK